MRKPQKKKTCVFNEFLLVNAQLFVCANQRIVEDRGPQCRPTPWPAGIGALASRPAGIGALASRPAGAIGDFNGQRVVLPQNVGIQRVLDEFAELRDRA